MRRLLAVVVAAGLLIGSGACSDDGDGRAVDVDSDVTRPPRPVTGAVLVLADPGLAAAMESKVPAFTEANPEATVSVESLDTAAIVARVADGQGDVVALVDATAMDELEGTGQIAAVVSLPRGDGARAGAVVASANPSAATRFVETVGG